MMKGSRRRGRARGARIPTPDGASQNDAVEARACEGQDTFDPGQGPGSGGSKEGLWSVVGGERGVALDRQTVADDRTIAPGPSRWRRAWQAGLRPRARWLLPAVACALVLLVLDGQSMNPGRGGLVTPGSLPPGAWLERVVWTLGVVWGGAGLLVLLVSALTQGLGGISSEARRRLRAAPPSPLVFRSIGLAAGVGLGVIGALAGVLAGAARSVDASEAGLIALWQGWALQLAAVLALGLSLAALGELVLDRAERRQRLRQSRQQVLDDLRASGGR